MADLLEELQRMTASSFDGEEIGSTVIERWQGLFGFSYERARDHIRQHRDNLGRRTISDELWRIVQDESEADGHDRESYEFSLHFIPSRKSAETHHGRPVANNATYIVRLESPIDTPQTIQKVANLGQEPVIFCGEGETGNVKFCRIDGNALSRLRGWITDLHPDFQPTTVRLSKSPKELCGFSRAPILGLDTTLPQNRPQTATFRPMPAQDQWPIWYFFYGNLAKAEELQSRLELVEPPEYIAARVYGAKIRSWRGRYNALVDAGAGVHADAFEDGSAYLVASEQDEDTLRFYETEKYEVVRCDIHMCGRIQPGLVFRFAGDDSELA